LRRKAAELSTKNTLNPHIQVKYSDSPTLPKPERFTSNTNHTINKTVDSEFIQCPLPEKESPSKMGSYQEEPAVAAAELRKSKKLPERIAEDDGKFIVLVCDLTIVFREFSVRK